MRTAPPTKRAENNSKYNKCMLECIGLSTSTELPIKLEREKTVFRVFGAVVKKKRTQYLFSFMEKHLIVSCS